MSAQSELEQASQSSRFMVLAHQGKVSALFSELKLIARS